MNGMNYQEVLTTASKINLQYLYYNISLRTTNDCTVNNRRKVLLKPNTN